VKPPEDYRTAPELDHGLAAGNSTLAQAIAEWNAQQSNEGVEGEDEASVAPMAKSHFVTEDTNPQSLLREPISAGSNESRAGYEQLVDTEGVQEYTDETPKPASQSKASRLRLTADAKKRIKKMRKPPTFGNDSEVRRSERLRAHAR